MQKYTVFAAFHFNLDFKNEMDFISLMLHPFISEERVPETTSALEHTENCFEKK
jgi:hypothetical protein